MNERIVIVHEALFYDGNALKAGSLPFLWQAKERGYKVLVLKVESESPYQDFVRTLPLKQGLTNLVFLACTHQVECNCALPNIGLVQDYITLRNIDEVRSFVMSDRISADKFGIFAKNLGLKVCLAEDKNLAECFTAFNESLLKIEVQRKTAETDVELILINDGRGVSDIATGIGFFDHMLTQIAKHSGISINLKAVGDLEVDEHHLIEDTGILLGKGLRKLVGNGLGMSRYGFTLPMDEALALVSLDLSGRGYLVFKGAFSNPRLGGFDTEMVEHFFRSLSENLGMSLHIEVSGENSHHKVEAIFKGFGRALGAALKCDARGGGIPSTKGIL